jgi:hypothetical protein
LAVEELVVLVLHIDHPSSASCEASSRAWAAARFFFWLYAATACREYVPTRTTHWSTYPSHPSVWTCTAGPCASWSPQREFVVTFLRLNSYHLHVNTQTHKRICARTHNYAIAHSYTRTTSHAHTLKQTCTHMHAHDHIQLPTHAHTRINSHRHPKKIQARTHI